MREAKMQWYCKTCNLDFQPPISTAQSLICPACRSTDIVNNTDVCVECNRLFAVRDGEYIIKPNQDDPDDVLFVCENCLGARDAESR